MSLIVRFWNKNQLNTFEEYGDSALDTAIDVAFKLAELFPEVFIEFTHEGKIVETQRVMPEKKAITTVVNSTGYAYYGSNMGPEYEGKPNQRKRHELKVSFILDMVPGAFHQPEDLMRVIAQNPYVDTVSYVKA